MIDSRLQRGPKTLRENACEPSNPRSDAEPLSHGQTANGDVEYVSVCDLCDLDPSKLAEHQNDPELMALLQSLTGLSAN